MTRTRDSGRVLYNVAHQRGRSLRRQLSPSSSRTSITTNVNESKDVVGCGHDLSASGYRFEQYISRGSDGFVILATDSEGKPHALKFIHLTQPELKYSEQEIINQFTLKHPHIIELEQILVTNQHLILVMEYAVGGDLFSLVFNKNGLGETNSRCYFQQLVLAVDFCHRMGVSNIDITLENLLLTSSGHGGSSREVLKIADFGFSRDINNDSTPTTRLGALNYIAPEVMCQTSQDFEYDACQSDVWSCGVVLYGMLSATYPFKRSSTIFSNIGNGFERCHANLLNEPFQPLSGVSVACNNLLSGMLNSDPKARLTLTQVMEHDWFEGCFNAGELTQFNEKLVNSLQTRSKHVEESMTQFRQQVQYRSMNNPKEVSN
jgi:serine/threonine-protein kinase SRK2